MYRVYCVYVFNILYYMHLVLNITYYISTHIYYIGVGNRHIYIKQVCQFWQLVAHKPQTQFSFGSPLKKTRFL